MVHTYYTEEGQRADMCTQAVTVIAPATAVPGQELEKSGPPTAGPDATQIIAVPLSARRTRARACEAIHCRQPGVAPLKRGCHHRRGHCHEGLLLAEGAATDGAARQPAEQLVGLLAERTERVDDERRDTGVVADVRRELMMLMRLAEFALLDDALLAIDVVVAPGLDVSRRQGMEDADVDEHCTVDTVHDDVWP